MNEIMVAFGISCVVIALYRLGVLYKKNTNISKNTLFLGTVTTVLLLEMLDAFTIDWLSDYLGRIYYNRFIGVLFDAMLIGIAFREPNEGLSYKEAVWARIQVLSGAAFFPGILCITFVNKYIQQCRNRNSRDHHSTGLSCEWCINVRPGSV